MVLVVDGVDDGGGVDDGRGVKDGSGVVVADGAVRNLDVAVAVYAGQGARRQGGHQRDGEDDLRGGEQDRRYFLPIEFYPFF